MLAGFLTPVLVFTLYQAGQRSLVEREAQELAQSYADADPETLETAGEAFGAGLW